MDVSTYHYYTQNSDNATFSAISQPSQASTNPTASCPPDQKEYPREYKEYSTSITPEEAWYLPKQAADMEPPRPSAGPLPAKLREELQPQSQTITIAPDENPLHVASPRGVSHVPGNAHHRATGNHLPGQATHVNQYMMGGTWKHGLCDFSDIGVCCTGILCPCILYGKTQYRLSQKSERKDPTNVLGYSIFNGACLAFSVLCGCNMILAVIQHSRVRQAYGIRGGVGTDFARAGCCCCCTLAQDEKEIKYRETKARSQPGLVAPMQYMSPKGMDFAAPP